jgi:hypothetical protein
MGGNEMMKVAAIIWIVVGTMLAGSGVLAVLSVPSLASDAIRYLPLVGIGGYVAAIPVALLIAKRLIRQTVG